MLDRLHALSIFGIKLGLGNIARLCAALGHPERTFTSIHIAGTNGKGSVTAFTHAALLAAGIRTARYTSPHLVHLRERFVIGADPVPEATLDEVGTFVLDTIDQLVASGELASPPTFFEATTGIAFELFRRAGVEVAVIEVGLGGRFDATNVLQAPIGAITSIALDHERHLGSTIAAIAFEKAGIIKPGMTVITGALPDDAATVVLDVARERGAAVVQATDGANVSIGFAEGRAAVTVVTAVATYGPVTLALRGHHQVGNALVAIRLLEAAARQGIPVSPQHIEGGLATAQWPARLELLTLPAGKRVLLDAAHNPEGAAALASYLGRWHPERPTLVVGVMADKDASGILRALLPVTSRVFTTAADNERALGADSLASQVRAIDPQRQVEAVAAAADAVARALDAADVICVAGSIYLAGEVRDSLLPRAILQ